MGLLATIRSFADGVVWASLATITQLANKSRDDEVFYGRTCLIPAVFKPSMISAAFSMLGMPGATQKPSIGRPSLRIGGLPKRREKGVSR